MKKTLNVGCGEKTYYEYPKGCKCINFDERSKLKNVDEVGDVRDLSRFDDAEFDFIIASDIIEHFPIAETTKILSEWCRVLKPGGIIEFRLPNLEAICKNYLEKGKNAKRTSWLLYGGQDYSGNFHYVCFDRAFFKDTCSKVGLKEIDFIEKGFNMVTKYRKL